MLCKENDSAVASGCFFSFLSRRFCYYASSAYYTSPLLPSSVLTLATTEISSRSRSRASRRSRQLSVFRSRNVNCASLPAARCRCPPSPSLPLPYSFAFVHCDLWSLLNGVGSDAFYAAAALRCFVTVVFLLLIFLLCCCFFLCFLFVNVGVKCQPAAGAYLLQLRPINKTK